MHKQTYHWRLFKTTSSAVERYCSHCGKKTVFTDSGKRRRNANGKNLYEYAIYKCERDHTWNRILKIYKAAEADEDIPFNEEYIVGYCNEDIELPHLIRAGIDEIEIVLEDVTGKWRLDKLLSEKIPDTSRNAICKMIETGAILVDGMVVKQNLNLKKDHVITIRMESVIPFVSKEENMLQESEHGAGIGLCN